MSRTIGHDNHARRGRCGKEYWKSRLHRGGEILGSYTKRLTHKKERMASKKEVETLFEEHLNDRRREGLD